MRNPKAPDARRDDMAKAAAPYVHPKLAAVQYTGQGGGPIQTVDLSKLDEQIAALASLYGPLAGAGCEPSGACARATEEQASGRPKQWQCASYVSRSLN
ncbi:hypothetical protein PY365_08805 [Roseiarcaceae bacterium H3SJ34-1]|uniref:hypothetical protein n=1 Tax=Terripilifer ovatus TaxID=3032367 RepID=UPI003AB9B256|nr:hypothetical protein [Roseiarcaceae bacterium H3SJ34-1]